MALRRACDRPVTTQTGMTARYRALDTYRFLAASGVVFYHFENHFGPLMAQPTHRLERFSLFVDFFFVLSGFVIMHTYGARIASWHDYGSFLRKRLARIYPLHLATLAIFCIIGAVVVAFDVQVRDRSFFDPTLIPANLLLVQAWGVTDHAGLNIPSWSISAEWFVYLLFPLLALLVRGRRPWFALGVALVVAIAIDLMRARVGLRPGEDATFDFGNLRAVASFLAGMAVCRLMPQTISRRVPWFVAHGFALGVLAADVRRRAGVPDRRLLSASRCPRRISGTQCAWVSVHVARGSNARRGVIRDLHDPHAFPGRRRHCGAQTWIVEFAGARGGCACDLYRDRFSRHCQLSLVRRSVTPPFVARPERSAAPRDPTLSRCVGARFRARPECPRRLRE